jgi:hypothetical protein
LEKLAVQKLWMKKMQTSNLSKFPILTTKKKFTPNPVSVVLNRRLIPPKESLWGLE